MAADRVDAGVVALILLDRSLPYRIKGRTSRKYWRLPARPWHFGRRPWLAVAITVVHVLWNAILFIWLTPAAALPGVGVDTAR